MVLPSLRVIVLLVVIVGAGVAQAGYISSAQVDVAGGPSCQSVSPPSPALCSIVGQIGAGAIVVNASGFARRDA